jgi:hypothetical protein
MDAMQALSALEQRLTGAGYDSERATIAGHGALVGRRSDFRWKWVATRLHTFVVAFAPPSLDEGLARWLALAAQQHAIDSKGGLPRGLQTGTATVPVFFCDAVEPGARAWFGATPAHRFSALLFPVLAEPGSGTVTYFRERMRLGSIYNDHLRGVVQDVIEPAVR